MFTSSILLSTNDFMVLVGIFAKLFNDEMIFFSVRIVIKRIDNVFLR